MPLPVVPILRTPSSTYARYQCTVSLESGSRKCRVMIHISRRELGQSRPMIYENTDLFKSIDSNVKVEIDGHSVRDEDTVVDVLEAFLFQNSQLAEEGRYVEYNSRALQPVSAAAPKRGCYSNHAHTIRLTLQSSETNPLGRRWKLRYAQQ